MASKEGGILKGPGIPAPSGQYRVGCVDLMHQLEGDDKGGLLLRLHYPTDATPEGYPYSLWSPHRKYIDGYMKFEKKKLSPTLIDTFMSQKIPALDGAPLFGNEATKAQHSPTFPVIIFSHGLGTMRATSSGITCDLASHGYIVASVEHREKSACAALQRVPKPDGRKGELQDQWTDFVHHNTAEQPEGEFAVRNQQLKQRVAEAKKSLDILSLLNQGAEINNMLGGSYNFKQFKGRLDIATAAIMGHSFGGATTVQTLSEDTRFKCGIALDCWMFSVHVDVYKNPSSVTQPLYFISSNDFQWKANVQKMMSLTKPPDANGMTPCRLLTLHDTNHYNQTDFFFIMQDSLGGNVSRLDISVAHKINLEIFHAFLKRHLLKDSAYQAPVPNLDGTRGHSEHIIFGAVVDWRDDDPAAGDQEKAGE